jgi:ATP-dependent RNA circularization protein (DNA/RNA ligase family)
MKTKKPSDILPEFPRMRHLPWKPNTERGDLVLSEEESQVIFEGKVYVQEKVDGSNCGMTIVDGQPLIRGRSKFIRKGYLPKTSATKQFASIFNWWHAQKKKFERLEKEAGPVSIYGEWMKAQHGMKYDRLPGWFIAFDLYDYDRCQFIDTAKAHDILDDCGFCTCPLLYQGRLSGYEQLDTLVNENTEFAKDEQREGLVVKVSDGDWLTHKFKMVRPGFKQGRLWNNDEMKVNSCG